MSRTVAADLLARARDDAEAVTATVAVAGVTDAIVGFHAQQAVEKAIKAVLAANGETFPFTHDLEGLIERCETAGLDVPAQLHLDAGLLTPYAVRHRYGGERRPSSIARQRSLSRQPLSNGPQRCSNPDPALVRMPKGMGCFLRAHDTDPERSRSCACTLGSAGYSCRAATRRAQALRDPGPCGKRSRSAIDARRAAAHRRRVGAARPSQSWVARSAS